MDVILLERVENLGGLGDVVSVRPGFARNFLLPQKKALRASETNRDLFKAQRDEIETRNLARKKEAEEVAGKIDGKSFVIIRQSSETGALYGSVSPRDIALAASADGIAIDRSGIRLHKPLKSLGIAEVRIILHPEVDARIFVNVARSDDEAQRQARGEDVLAQDRGDSGQDENDGDSATPEFFDAHTGTAVEDAGAPDEKPSGEGE